MTVFSVNVDNVILLLKSINIPVFFVTFSITEKEMSGEGFKASECKKKVQ